MTVAATTASTARPAAASSTPLSSLSGNFQDFLRLLMTQLQNQDPTSPTDPNQFTSELVQFASVEQQINTNSSLSKLIEATQGNEVLQGSALVGKQVTVASDHVALQNGAARLNFNTTVPQTVNIGVYADSGAKLRDATVNAAAGSNKWNWDGRDNRGNPVADGAYRVTVRDTSGGPLDFTVTGTATAMQRTGDAVGVSLGALAADLSAVRAVGN